MRNEIYDSSMGPIYVRSNPYCIGCPRFEPFARRTCKTGKDGKVLWDGEGRAVPEGISISCTHEYLCQHIAHETRKRVKEKE